MAAVEAGGYWGGFGGPDDCDSSTGNTTGGAGGSGYISEDITGTITKTDNINNGDGYARITMKTKEDTALILRYDVNGGIEGEGVDYSNSSQAFTPATFNTLNPIHSLKDFHENGNLVATKFGFYTGDWLVGSPTSTIKVSSGASFSSFADLCTALGGGIDISNNDVIITLYAEWIPIEFSINYDTAGGVLSPLNPTTYTIETPDITIINPTRNTDLFTGWQVQYSNFLWTKGYISKTGAITTSTTYPNACYSTPIKLSNGVKYTLSGYGSYSADNIIWRVYREDGTFLTSKTGKTYTPTQNCYAKILFTAKPTEAQKSGTILTSGTDPNTMVIPQGTSGDILLTAKYQLDGYFVEFNPNGATEGEIYTREFYFDEVYTLSNDNFSWQGHRFTGWNTKADGTGISYAEDEEVVNLTTVSEATVKLYAQWEAYKVDIKICLNGGVLKPNHGSAYGTVEEDGLVLLTQNGSTIIHTLQYNGRLDSNGLINCNNASACNLDRPGATIAGTSAWNTMPDGSGTTFDQTTRYYASAFADLSEGDQTVILYANWTYIDKNGKDGIYTISYNLDGGTISNGYENPTSYTLQSPDITIVNPIKAGYRFIGWQEEISDIGWFNGSINDSTGAIQSNSTSYYSTDIYVYEGNTYTISGTSYAATKMRWRAYHLDGTYIGSTTGATYTPTEDCYVKILFYNEPTTAQLQNVVVSFTASDINVGPTYINPKTIKSGSTGDLLLTANWESMANYTLTANPNGGEFEGTTNPTVLTTTLLYNSSDWYQIGLATRPGYSFNGWYDSPTGGNLVYAVTDDTHTTCVNGDYWNNNIYIAESDLTVYAHWTEQIVTMQIRKNDTEWNDSGIRVALYQGNQEIYSYQNTTTSPSTNVITFHGVANGEYDVYASLSDENVTNIVDTGTNIIVDGIGTHIINYYTLQLNNGIGISAVSGEGTYLENQPINIDATVSNGYTWQGWSVISGDSPN